MLYGRDAERALIGALLDAARASRSGALVLRGDAGVGKTALLEEARELAADMRVLTARAVESESELPFAALHQLLRPVLPVLDHLPPPQATALRSALGLEDGAGRERFLVYSACLSLLSEVADAGPVLCLVDDAHWLDAGSSDALQFIARRLDAEGIVLLFGAREGEPRDFDAVGVPSHTVAGLDAGAAAELLSHGPVKPAPAVRDRLLAQTHGNPLALVELPSALNAAQLAGDEPLPTELPMTRQLESVFHERVGRLSDETRRLLLVAAADDAEDVGLISRAATALGAGPHALDAAEQAGLVVVEGSRLAFRHPLVRSAVYRAAPSRERRAAHGALAAALAGAMGGADRRAWHLASSVVDPDATVAEALDEAAERAAGRAGHIEAARALERAAELSGDPAAQTRRLVRAASLTSLAGRDAEASALADRAAPLATQPELRAEVAQVLGVAALRQGRPADAVPTLVEAADEVAGSDPARALDLMLGATAAAWQSGARAALLEVGRRVATIDPPEGDEASAFAASFVLGVAGMLGGDTARGVARLEEAVRRGAVTDDPRHALFASLGSIWLADDEAAGALVRRAVQVARRRGELGTLAEALGGRAAHFVLAQRFEEASVAAEEAVRLARELHAENLVLIPLATLAIIAAIQGRDDEARRHGEEVLGLATAKGLPQRAALAAYALAIADVGNARWVEALEHLASLEEDGSGAKDPVMAALMLPDKIEAAVRAGRPDTAAAALAHFEAWATHSGAPAAQPRVASCRALLADGQTATEHFEAALALAADARPFDLARIRLLYGEHLRRERQRTEARSQLRAALEAFERFGAEPWAERARAELRATGETARRRDPATVDQLTPQELQIARFVADGLSNKEVAAQMFLSPRTIDAHLRSVFAKLGVTSRTQLASRPLGSEEPDASASLA